LGLHKGEHVAIKEVDLEELADKNLDNLSVIINNKIFSKRSQL
jgi:hypothetical protein